jgi:hypothetical protein
MMGHQLIDEMTIDHDQWINLCVSYPTIAGRCLSINVKGDKPVQIGGTYGGEPTGSPGSFETWHPGSGSSVQFRKCTWVRGRGAQIAIWALGKTA